VAGVGFVAQTTVRGLTLKSFHEGRLLVPPELEEPVAAIITIVMMAAATGEKTLDVSLEFAVLEVALCLGTGE
jgi:hypothetical protein